MLLVDHTICSHCASSTITTATPVLAPTQADIFMLICVPAAPLIHLLDRVMLLFVAIKKQALIFNGPYTLVWTAKPNHVGTTNCARGSLEYTNR